jgi:hypothetical protein
MGRNRDSRRIWSLALPYRWGYFQGAILIPWSLFFVVGSILELRKPASEPLYVPVMVLLIGFVGLPLSVGLLLKKKFGLVLVYVTVGLTFLLVAIKLPVAMRHYTDSGEAGSVIPEAEMLLVWLFSMLYYKKRQAQFRSCTTRDKCDSTR